ncbi:hypothetical protein [Variovorax sp. GT1P44]|uniref:hypothetical protein n=1 Tax=Variovorax sp. GT1P44 TaxID=3443742 RepID=UPI003F44E8E2
MDQLDHPLDSKQAEAQPSNALARQANADRVGRVAQVGLEAAEARSRQILASIKAFSKGDFRARLPGDWPGTDGHIAESFNHTIAQAEHFTQEFARLSVTVGKEGRLSQRIAAPGALGSWAAQVDALNRLVDDLVRPTTDIARTIGAVAKGDLGQSMDLQVDGRALKGEFHRSAKLVNSMIEQLSEPHRLSRRPIGLSPTGMV